MSKEYQHFSATSCTPSENALVAHQSIGIAGAKVKSASYDCISALHHTKAHLLPKTLRILSRRDVSEGNRNQTAKWLREIWPTGPLAGIRQVTSFSFGFPVCSFSSVVCFQMDSDLGDAMTRAIGSPRRASRGRGSWRVTCAHFHACFREHRWPMHEHNVQTCSSMMQVHVLTDRSTSL